jgi:hypothetical protein
VKPQGEVPLMVERLSSHECMVKAMVPLTDETVAAIEAAFGAARRIDSFELHGRVTKGAELVAEFRVPLLSGEPATVWSGVSASYLVDWDVDVAGDTAIGNPSIGSFLDGFALAFVAQPIGERRMQLLARGVLNFLERPPTEKPLANPYTPFIEEVAAQRLFVDETRNVSAQDGAFEFRFGGAPLLLELTVTRR